MITAVGISETRAGLRRAVTASLMGGAGAALAVTLVTPTLIGTWDAASVAVAAGVVSTAILAALVLGGRRGLTGLWGLMLLLWLSHLARMLEWGFGRARMMGSLPDDFVVWSVLALPLAAATTYLLRGLSQAPVRGRAVPAVFATWLVLAAACAWVSGHAPDVGGGPRYDPLVGWPMVLLLPPVPLLLGGWMIRRLHRSRIGLPG